MSLETSRLILLPCAPEQLLALIEHPERFEELIGFPAADGLREFFVSGWVSPKWLAALRSASGPDPWRYGFFVLDREGRCVIGTAGFKGPPDASGMVEIAYGIAPAGLVLPSPRQSRSLWTNCLGGLRPSCLHCCKS